MMSRSSFALAMCIAAILLTSPAHAAASGREVFEDKCASCHGVDGKARTPAGKKLGAKDLSGSKLEDTAIEQQIRNGAKDARGSEKMPPFKDKLTRADITSLVAYVKTFRAP